ncbi:hypothetical protein [Campylobacter gastrosuis]|uniref:DUF983 domain-containing protein n=1 Tax=Campylobacter gastrosuis TaxID=2974576 RepID=A0ABT7HSQ9_9BACT|nr:hypothetical protein [Campylobacter gastrosuis]MDL0089874.1 hypothetical protein [Campylobacter gastrosuis]
MENEVIYKKCEVCSKKVNRLQNLFTFNFDDCIKCKNCGTKYEISNIKFCNFLSNIIETFYALFCIFFSIGFAIYIDENFDIHWLVSVFIFAFSWFLLSFICMFLEWLILLLFVAKIEILKDERINKKQKIAGSFLNKLPNVIKNK